MAVDGSGNVYVVDVMNDAVEKMTPNCASKSCVTQMGGNYNFSYPQGVVVDGNGNVYVADTGNSLVKEITPSCANSSCVTQLGASLSFSYPDGVAVDGSGNVYVADNGNNAVKEMTPGCTSNSCVTSLGGGSSFSGPTGVAVDGSGNVYVADGAVEEMTPNCTSSSCVTGLGNLSSLDPYGIAVDGRDNVYVADPVNMAVYEVLAVNGSIPSNPTVTQLGSFGQPFGVAVDSSGNVYVPDASISAVYELFVSSVNFGAVGLGVVTPPMSLNFVFDASGTLASAPTVVTQGAANLDFADAGTGSCDTNGTSHQYNKGNTCTVNATFTPARPGPRYGAAILVDNFGNSIIGNLQGTGVGPQANFLPGSQGTLGSFFAPYGAAVDSKLSAQGLHTKPSQTTHWSGGGQQREHLRRRLPS